jgi:hypothetical protein
MKLHSARKACGVLSALFDGGAKHSAIVKEATNMTHNGYEIAEDKSMCLVYFNDGVLSVAPYGLVRVYEYSKEKQNEKQILYDVCNDYSLDPSDQKPNMNLYKVTKYANGELLTHKEYGEVHFFRGLEGLKGKYLSGLMD